MPPEGAREGLPPQEIIELLEAALLGGPPTLTSDEVAARTGVPKEVARERWRALGFTQVPDGEAAFTDADVHAMQLVERLLDLGLADAENESALIRTVGRGFARLAEFETGVIARSLDLADMGSDQLAETLDELMPLLEEVMCYVWRRHAVSAGARLALATTGDGSEPQMVAGFADIVGYTARSRSMRADQLASLVEEFEARTVEIVGDHKGRVIKTIGDEVFFVADDPLDGALIALELLELAKQRPEFPTLHIGLAFGPVLARLGDVYGPVVNLASRLTSVARPGRVVVDRHLAEALMDRPEVRVRRMRRTAVKGYRLVEPWSLKRPRVVENRSGE
ncbi:MAG: adenylate/guanylate cyclase domain-containing protein [Marmoricola sp.]